MKFFNTNYLFTGFAGSVDASSNPNAALFPFNELNKYPWVSESEGTDGNAIYLERVLEAPSPIDSIFVTETNISDLTIEVDIGAGYVSLATASTFTLTKSNAGDSYVYELDSSIALEKIKFIGSNTIIANEEKSIGSTMAFIKLGQIADFDDIRPTRERIQVVSKLNSGKFDVVNKGRQWMFKLKLKTHYVEADNDIINTLLQREAETWIWINDNNEDSMKMIQEPYRFGDIYKTAIQKKDSPSFTGNMFFSGIDDTITFVEVA